MPSAGSGTVYDVLITGTVAAHSTAHVKITLTVTNTNISNPRNEMFYREIDFNNTTFSPQGFHGTYSLAIVPELYITDTVQVSLSWSY